MKKIKYLARMFTFSLIVTSLFYVTVHADQANTGVSISFYDQGTKEITVIEKDTPTRSPTQQSSARRDPTDTQGATNTNPAEDGTTILNDENNPLGNADLVDPAEPVDDSLTIGTDETPEGEVSIVNVADTKLPNLPKTGFDDLVPTIIVFLGASVLFIGLSKNKQERLLLAS